MFRLIEPSSGQNYSTGTFSECVHYGSVSHPPGRGINYTGPREA